MTKTFSNEDLGLDDTPKSTCMACRKSSDGAKTCHDGTVLCGTHYDEYLAALRRESALHAKHFAKELREGKFKPCWDAQLTEGEPT